MEIGGSELGSDRTQTSSDDQPAQSVTPQRSGIALFGDIYRRGPASLANLSLYAFGVSGLWTALGTPLLPIKINEIVGNGGSSVLGVLFDGNDKNGALGIVSLLGLVVAAAIQPIAGTMSDRHKGATKRLPYMLIGSAGMAVAVLFLGIVGTLLSLIILNVFIQGFGNFGQGAANGLIADHVPHGRKGSAAGALNLARVVGAGILTGVIFILMSRYDQQTAPGWMTVSVILLATAALSATLWTVTSLWRSAAKNSRDIEANGQPLVLTDVDPSHSSDAESAPPRTMYFRFLVALSTVITGFSALQLYSFFYLEDVIGLENAAMGAVAILASTAIATALTVVPAGRMTDRLGRDQMLIAAGTLGVLSAVLLMFASSVLMVTIIGLMVGMVIGIFLTVSWALANDLVSRQHAARDLGYASIAVLIGSTTSRISGIGVDRLNDIQPALGYQAVLGAVALCFIITVILMTRL
ncbi:MAG: MFS transporter, partial [Chloroflexi bacterium]|nr:MFS transporter [Chloroflexota bacterium]